MRILIVSHYFPPEVGAPQARLSELASLWTSAGEEVTVLTAMPNHPSGVVHLEYRGEVRLEEKVDGYRVVRTWVYATPNEGVVRKTLGHLSFMVTSVVLGGRRVGHADVVVVSSPTFFSIFAAWALARVKGARLVIEVRDLWPAVFVELGVITNRWLIQLLEALELASYRAADAVVVVSEGFRGNLISRGVPPNKVHTIRNGADLALFEPSRRAIPAIRKRLGAADEELLVLYLGAHGISHGLATVVEAATKLTGEPVHVALVGEGAEKARISRQVAEAGASNVTLLPAVPREHVPDILAAADVCLVSLREVPLFRAFIPSKVFEYLAAGKPVIGAVRGEAAEIITEAGGLVVEPGDPSALADAIRQLADDPTVRKAMGDQGRAYVAKGFDRRRLAEQYRHVLRGLVGAG